ncbi:DUF632 domain-containing protein/DUF630 domain-containing protein [Cinnamomum micranthum f. kanehirae]|uniref:DUF632 domain-containing protein/DUF630 domain-containing protein n=1 Tax=Cinnamomum micranthum f. kanehirae TaxID=337451 RepID=A0A443NJG0_9MAGN|nr:DUF632 domain-containing protein/DUF630 domain-containing protein [Cinnamomum micranthum f. kanehirae]
MGCNSSKAEDLPLVSVCRERKELIRSAADHRYALAAAHSAYFESLRRIGHVLYRFVNEELSSSSSVVTSSPSSHKNKPSSLSSSSSMSDNSPPSKDSHLRFHSDSGSISGDEIDSGGPRPSSPPAIAANQYYMKSSSSIPSMIYQQQPPDLHPSYSIGEGPIGSSPRDRKIPAQTTPPPPPPEVSGWDFLNPFSSFESFNPSYSYPMGKYGSGSIASSPDWAQVREREGIPDLEDEMAEQFPAKEAKKEETKKAQVRSAGGDFGEGTSKAAPLQGDRTKNSRRGGGGTKNSVANVANDKHVRKKGVGFGVESSVSDSIESSQGIQLDTISSHRTAESIESLNLSKESSHQPTSIWEIVKEIKDQFETAFAYGKEVSVLLEAGKLQYQPNNPTFEVLSCRVLDAIDPPKLTSSRSSSKRLHNTAAYALAKTRDRVPGMKSGSLSLTLEKLYAWERKLYKEVKDEEKLRVIYEKKCKQLRLLDNRGEETNKIDATQASIRKLLAKINITIKAIHTISSRIHKLRDEELQPQLTELIQGLVRMWKNMVKCHQKQFQKQKSQSHREKLASEEIPACRLPKNWEQELIKWYSHFKNWISTQRAYVEALNGWLLKCLLQEPEETPDGIVPFSPSRVGAPPIFIICNDLVPCNGEDFRKLKAEFLSKDFERRLKSLRQEGGLHGNRKALDKKALSASNKDSVVFTR